MPQKDYQFNPANPGDPITARAWNEIGMQVMRLSGAPGVNSISTGAGVFTRTLPNTSSPVAYFSLNDNLYRTKSASADKLTFGASDWEDSGDDETLYGDFATGYWFAEDRVQAIKSTTANRWYVLGCGHTTVRGVLDQTVNTGGDKVTVSVYSWSSPTWADSGTDLRVREVMGIASPVASTTVVTCAWHEQGQMWTFAGAECN